MVRNTPKRGAAEDSSGAESGISVHAAMAKNDRPRIQRIASAPTTLTSQLPIGARAGVIRERGDEDAEHDGDGLAEARGQQQRQQLGLVTDLGQRDHAGGDEQGFQMSWTASSH